MEKKKWFWGLVGLLIVALIYAAVSGELSTSSSTSNQGAASQEAASNQTQVPQESAPQVSTPSPQESAPQASNSGTQVPPRDSNGLIHQLTINASVESRSIAFTSGANYTNCTDDLTVITVDGNQQPVFTTYKDNYGSINLFAGDAHSVAYGSLTDNNGNTLASDIVSGKYGNNTAGTWGLTCDQGEYTLTINTIN